MNNLVRKNESFDSFIKKFFDDKDFLTPKTVNFLDRIYHPDTIFNLDNVVTSVANTNIKETEDSYLIDVQAPGFEKEDLKIDIVNNVLTISGEIKKEEKDEKNDYCRKEFTKTSFSRSFSVPDDVNDEIDATFKNGILSLIIKKKQKEEKKKRVDIK